MGVERSGLGMPGKRKDVAMPRRGGIGQGRLAGAECWNRFRYSPKTSGAEHGLSSAASGGGRQGWDERFSPRDLEEEDQGDPREREEGVEDGAK
jgi:hypothetical protein